MWIGWIRDLEIGERVRGVVVLTSEVSSSFHPFCNSPSSEQNKFQFRSNLVLLSGSIISNPHHLNLNIKSVLNLALTDQSGEPALLIRAHPTNIQSLLFSFFIYTQSFTFRQIQSTHLVKTQQPSCLQVPPR